MPLTAMPRPIDSLSARLALHAAERGALHAVRVRLPQYGTRSASLVALTAGRVAHYAFADGAPGDAPFVDFTGLLGEVGR